jgi:hydroxymethylglutaryl-CoA synthase
MYNVGILGYGIYIPRYRIRIDDIAAVWGKNAADIKKSLGVSEKAIASLDEDAVTLAYEAAISALKHADISPSSVEVCMVGSESHPYAVNPTSTIVAEFLGVGRNYLACDLEFACKAATSGMIAIFGLISSGKASIGLCIGTDSAQAKPHDVLEYTAAGGAAAFILGKETDCLAKIVDFASFTSDTPDFWRRDGVRFPSHGGRFTGEPAYFAHIEGSAKHLLHKLKLAPSDFAYCIFHMPNGKFPREVARRLGFSEKQLSPSLIVDKIGNPFSASSLLGLAAVLDQARANQLIFMASYGSGAGSDSFVFEVNKNIEKRRNLVPTFSTFMKNKQYVSYVDYLKYRGKI